MESRAKALGHPIHPMLIVFPLGLFVAAVIFDVLYLVYENPFYSIVAYYNIAGGIIGGLLAAIFGFRDYLAIPSNTRAKSVGAAHGIINLALVVLFFASWFLRRGAPDFAPSTLALVLSFGAALLGAISGWLGGELVYRLDVGVDHGAHLDAPSSLSDRPASAGLRRGAGVPVTGENHPDDYEDRG